MYSTGDKFATGHAKRTLTMKIDSHQHFWNLAEVEYPWLEPAYGPIYDTFTPEMLAPQLLAAGIDKTVLVQSANSYEDTASMLVQSDEYDWIGAVIGWVDLLRPVEAEKRLDMYAKHPKWRGIRHLIHTEPDPDWVVQGTVIDSLKLLAERDMIFEVVAVFPNHLKHVPKLAEKVPNLRMVIDHLAKPPIKDREMGVWAEQFKAAAQSPNVYAKVSGLNTAADWNTWTGADLKPYIDYAIECFGANRLMFGSDWPVAILAGDYAKVWDQTNVALVGHAKDDIDAILGGTAQKVYKI
jgi:L-fuconolactonase